MKKAGNHIIQTQSIAINFNDLDDAFGVQNRIAELFYERLQPKMSLLFDEMFGGKYYASIDHLEIDCGLLSNKNWEDEMVEETMRKLKQALITVDKKPVSSFQFTVPFIFFLRHGYLPWNAGIVSIAELEKLIPVDDELIVALKELLSVSEIVADRLAYQFSEDFREKLVQALSASQKNILRTMHSFTEKPDLGKPTKKMIHAAFFRAFSKDRKENTIQKSPAIFLKKVESELNIQVKKPLAKTGLKVKKEQIVKAEDENTEQAIYIINAGLVIVHPFLEKLFENFNLIKDCQWNNAQSQHLAALILEFINTGGDEFPEFNLPLNKILCGIDIEETLKIESLLTAETKTECESLLKEIIKHWTALKHTGIDALRETFFHRNGKLSRVDNGWLLQVEQKGVDVLMNSLPWGIGTIKLPWMKDVLYVEWIA